MNLGCKLHSLPSPVFDEFYLWMPEIGLGIGRDRGTYQGITREWLYWYDQNGNRYSTPEEIAVQQQQQLEQTQQQLQEILTRLQQRGIDPDTL